MEFAEKGSITVSLKPVDSGVELAVADTGVGIPAGDLPHVFEEFRQVDRQVGDKTEGTGLGLAIAVVVMRLLGPRVNQADALRRNLDRCLFQLAGLGLAPQPGETLQQFCDRAAVEEPSLAPTLQALANAYNRARFGQPSAPLKDAAKAWRQLHRQLGQRARRPTSAASLS